MKKVDSILGFVLLGICGLFFSLISKLPDNARLYPLFVTILLTVLTVIHLIITYAKKVHLEDKEFKNLEIKQLLFVLGTSGLYVLLINLLGYVVSTVLFVITVLLGLKVSKKSSVLIGTGFATVVYILFKMILNVPLPQGLFI